MMSWMLSPWFWWAFALALFALEALAPGTFMLWLGFAAVGTALAVLLLPMSLSAQWILFGVLGLIAVGAGWQWRKRYPPSVTDQPALNRRAERLRDQVLTLETAIVNGHGRARVGDSLWTVLGPDLPAGTRVRVVGADGTRLQVQAVE